MNKTKKAQITIFVILGLVLLIIFFIFIAIRRTAEPKITDVQDILNELEAGRIKNHITNCIIQTAMDGIEKIGANGGVIYDFEGGTIPFQGKVLGQDYLDYTYLNQPFFVAYALKENIPYNANCLYNPSCSAYDGFYGRNVMSKLCIRESGCETFAKGEVPGLTIQWQLQDYVANKTPLCVDFSAFTSRMPVDISAEAKPVVEVNIHESEVVFLVKYPVKISFENQAPVTDILDYQTTIKVRLGLIYYLLHNALVQDSKKIEFNINNEYTMLSYQDDGLKLSKINDPCTTCELPFKYDDIINITDRKSLINGRPFLFRAAVMNRKPALDFIDDVSYNVPPTNKVSIQLKAFDPDDGDVTYMFLSQEPLGCWHEGAIIQDGWLNFTVDTSDVGDHKVGILVYDDSGLFDYQHFWINITSASLPPGILPACMGDTCLLVNENSSGVFMDSCYDFASLSTITISHPAYISVS